MHMYRCGLVSVAGGVRARELLERYTRLESSSIERRGLDREARGHQAGGALQGERNRSALHLAIAIRLRCNANSRASTARCEVAEAKWIHLESLFDGPLMPTQAIRESSQDSWRLLRPISYFLRSRARRWLEEPASQDGPHIHGQRHSAINNRGVRLRRIAVSRDGPPRTTH